MAVLVLSEEQYLSAISNFCKCQFYTTDYLLSNKYNKILNIYDCNWIININENDIKWISNNWYKVDHKSYTFSKEFGLSYFQAMTESNHLLIANLIRDFNAFQNISLEYEKIIIPKDNFFTKELIISYFNFLEVDMPPVSNNNDYFISRVIPFPNQIPYFKAFIKTFSRKLQELFYKKKLLGKTICFADWTNQSFLKGKKNILSTRLSLNIFSTVYYNTNKNLYASTKKNNLNTFIPFDLFKSNLLTKFDKKVSSELLKFIYDLLLFNFKKNVKQLDAYLDLYFNLIDSYQPESIIVPSEKMDFYTLLLQICNLRGVKTKLLTDGFPLTYSENRTLISLIKNKYLIDKVFVFGEMAFSNKQVFNILKSDRIGLTTPLLERYAKLKIINKEYDVIIMSYMFNDYNPNARPDLIISVIIKIVDLLYKLNYNKIAIKVKGNRDYNYYMKIFSNLHLKSKIKILDGMFYNHICKTNFVIGGLSTALAECVINNIPYYVFEPDVNGFSDDYINSTFINNSVQISRSIYELETSIINNLNTSIIEREKFLIYKFI